MQRAEASELPVFCGGEKWRQWSSPNRFTQPSRLKILTRFYRKIRTKVKILAFQINFNPGTHMLDLDPFSAYFGL